MTLLVIHEENEPQTENPLRGVAYPLTLSQVQLGLDLAALRSVASGLQLGSQFFDVLFDRHRLISLSL
ncbi:hypothetical protein ACFFQG_31875, partial [Shinella granuli]